MRGNEPAIAADQASGAQWRSISVQMTSSRLSGAADLRFPRHVSRAKRHCTKLISFAVYCRPPVQLMPQDAAFQEPAAVVVPLVGGDVPVFVGPPDARARRRHRSLQRAVCAIFAATAQMGTRSASDLGPRASRYRGHRPGHADALGEAAQRVHAAARTRLLRLRQPGASQSLARRRSACDYAAGGTGALGRSPDERTVATRRGGRWSDARSIRRCAPAPA